MLDWRLLLAGQLSFIRKRQYYCRKLSLQRASSEFGHLFLNERVILEGDEHLLHKCVAVIYLFIYFFLSSFLFRKIH